MISGMYAPDFYVACGRENNFLSTESEARGQKKVRCGAKKKLGVAQKS